MSVFTLAEEVWINVPTRAYSLILEGPYRVGWRSFTVVITNPSDYKDMTPPTRRTSIIADMQARKCALIIHEFELRI